MARLTPEAEAFEVIRRHRIADAIGLPVTEHRFHPVRRWRFDLAWSTPLLPCPIAIEIEGGTRSGGRHVRGDGYERDCEKYNAAALMGWVVLRFTTQMVRDGRLEAALDELWPE